MFAALARQLWATPQLFSWYFSHLRLLNTLPAWVTNPDELTKELASGRPLVFPGIPNAVRDRYNASIKELGETIKHAGSAWLSFDAMMIAFLTLRAITVYIAWAYPDRAWVTVCVSLAQFGIMPYSFFASVMGLITLLPPLYLGHILVFGSLQAMFSVLPPLPEWAFLTINPTFIAWFFVVDQLACLVCVWQPGSGAKAAPLPVKSVLKSFVYGAFNCKSYFAVMLFLMQGYRVNLAVWAIDAALSLSYRANLFLCRHTMHWSVLFYHQHRLAHLPVVYEQAHKCHHYLRDVTAFDADIFGAGAPEEWGSIMAELVITLGCGITPPFLSVYMLRTSWENKTDHTRKEDETGGVNMHVDHHRYHNRNYALVYSFLDMYMLTASDNKVAEAPGYTVVKEDTGDQTVFTFTPLRP